MIGLQVSPESQYPKVVMVYRQRYDKMATQDYREELCNYAEEIIHDPIKNLDWRQLLAWEHRHLIYTREELPKPRAELPIAIIAQAKGRCGEFALLYTGLLLANHYEARLVVDCSVLKDRSKKDAGDHVWNEIIIDHISTHVDPTERRINQPLMYQLEWKKDVNLVYAIAEKEILEVTKNYNARSRVNNRSTDVL